jgi:mono/diheme cytochrome c family protein
MPRFFDREKASDRAHAADLAAYLTSLRATGAEAAPDASPGKSARAPRNTPLAERPNARLGERLFEQLSCLACHHFGEPEAADRHGRLSLAGVSAKFQPGALRRFLLAPHANYRHSRMPDFALSPEETAALEAFLLRDRQSPEIPLEDVPEGDAARGREKFADLGCAACHAPDNALRGKSAGEPGVLAGAINAAPRRTPAARELFGPPDRKSANGGCIAADAPESHPGPHYRLSSADREALIALLRHGAASWLGQRSPVEAARRAMERLQCAACHDRDGERSPRRLILAEEGSGRVPDVLPDLTWAGEKLQTTWVEGLLRGAEVQPMRPWLAARMPRFPAVAETLAVGLAARHGLTSAPIPAPPHDPETTEIGRELASRNGLDCRQCHGVGNLLPRGDDQTRIALGINFADVRRRLRPDYYHRFLRDPVRWDPSTKMPRLSADGISTKIRTFYDGNAGRQFAALWQYIHHFDRRKGSTPEAE